ncbi:MULTISPECIES: 5'/3'-nucleotidase SurE [Kosmotoga]|uniref:5'-nucleotidase SurE n=1 Tax=Kosmotoga olearia (strain ATCC BAA-1733 / DSM 21960 / TBF 19.5.1) TaxID=521045 RepID=SURE_KOSOT|nr:MULTISPECIES: 5'/3'-nucleotidase SurE [Kosmotoga]C5CG17.1 RecName: Full=5'-nucleotidase SurE; AltName: Full=Nucleoside 5'-monophosphate phosphohydrolase [Kosmotoga olearia TBF 19.5.1]ACR79458.1 stationary-phase survival protein SurE [Kosmotoga olearia TBF 19.5.1]MDI3524310.1 5/3-nucleotidase [Kosmotoga sp.]MDK2954080.1 5/3-nucleotidase [Kosmotoga sp.]OAA22477.1 stationary phase survival protein SurE [Kosmotoga sp. DU53]
MNILVTNDDGIMAPGINILAQKLAEKHSVLVVAPDVERSATGHAITIRTPLWAKEVKVGEKTVGYAINGTPADCVKLGILAIADFEIELVVSGINKGPNLGTDILYSGTVSGALEGAVMEKPSIAISAADWNNPKYETAAEFLLEFLDTYDVTKMPEFTALNINVPSVDRAELKGWKVTRQSRRRYRDYFEKRKDPYGNNYYWMFGEIIEDDPGEDSDYAAVRRNYVSITPIYAFMTNQNYMPKLKEELEGGN